MPKAATTGFFLSFFETFSVSPWSPCPNATYVSPEKIFSLLLMKDHPCEIFITLILSPWRSCQRQQPQVNFSSLWNFLWKSVKSVSKCHVCIGGKRTFCFTCERPPWWNFKQSWWKSVKSMPKVSKCHALIWETKIFFTACEIPPRWNFEQSWLKSVKSVPKCHIWNEEKIFSVPCERPPRWKF